MNDTVYSSVFKKELQDLVDLKRALGFAYHTEACAFRRIDSFFIENRLSTKCVTKELCDLWCRKKATSLSPTRLHASVRSGFSADTWMT